MSIRLPGNKSSEALTNQTKLGLVEVAAVALLQIAAASLRALPDEDRRGAFANERLNGSDRAARAVRICRHMTAERRRTTQSYDTAFQAITCRLAPLEGHLR